MKWWFAGKILADGAVEMSTSCKLRLEIAADLWKRPGCAAACRTTRAHLEGGCIFRWDEEVADGLREEGGGLSSRASWLAGMARGVSHRQWNWQFFDFDKMRCGFL